MMAAWAGETAPSSTAPSRPMRATPERSKFLSPGAAVKRSSPRPGMRRLTLPWPEPEIAWVPNTACTVLVSCSRRSALVLMAGDCRLGHRAPRLPHPVSAPRNLRFREDPGAAPLVAGEMTEDFRILFPPREICDFAGTPGQPHWSLAR